MRDRRNLTIRITMNNNYSVIEYYRHTHLYAPLQYSSYPNKMCSHTPIIQCNAKYFFGLKVPSELSHIYWIHTARVGNGNVL